MTLIIPWGPLFGFSRMVGFDRTVLGIPIVGLKSGIDSEVA